MFDLLAIVAIVACSCALFSCVQYYSIADNFRIQTNRMGANNCTGAKGPEVAEVIELIKAKADALGIVDHWPPAPISVCIVERAPFVVCGGAVLSGCAWSDKVIVPLQVVVKLGEARLRDDYVWQNQFAHEMTAALTLQGVLKMPKTEAKLIASPGYKALLAHVRETLKP